MAHSGSLATATRPKESGGYYFPEGAPFNEDPDSFSFLDFVNELAGVTDSKTSGPGPYGPPLPGSAEAIISGHNPEDPTGTGPRPGGGYLPVGSIYDGVYTGGGGGFPTNRTPAPPMPSGTQPTQTTSSGSGQAPWWLGGAAGGGAGAYDWSFINETPTSVVPSGIGSGTGSQTGGGTGGTNVAPPPSGGGGIPWDQIIRSGGALLSTAIGVYGSGKAADEFSDAGRYVADQQMQQYYQTRQDLMPWLRYGTGALQEMGRQLGVAPSNDPGLLGAGTIDPNTFPRSGQANEGMIRQAFQQFHGREPSDEELRYYQDRDRADQLFNDVVAKGYQPGVEPPKPSLVASDGSQTGTGDRYGAFQETPGYQFRFDEAMRATDIMGRARGRRYSGGTIREAERYASGLAEQEYGNYFARLQGMSGTGVTSGQNIGAFGAGAVANAGTARLGAAASRASGIANQTSALGNLAEYGANQWADYLEGIG